MCGWVTTCFHCRVCFSAMIQKVTLPVRCKEHRDANREWGTLGHVQNACHKVISDFSRACARCDPVGLKYPDPWYFDPPPASTFESL